jgi:hypothetical protein
LLKPADPVGIASEGSGEDLERNVTTEPWVASAVHLAHSARADERKDLVRTQTTPHGEGHKDIATILLLALREIIVKMILSARSCETLSVDRERPGARMVGSGGWFFARTFAINAKGLSGGE